VARAGSGDRPVVLDAHRQDASTGRVTLWRRARKGPWKVVLRAQPTLPDVTVDLSVDQAGVKKGVYRLTFVQEGSYGSSTSRSLTVTRQ
jgi:hypothetical protein